MTCEQGSSPRMRGAQMQLRIGEGAVGIIPADAGSTAGTAGRHCADQDHPRGCGEHLLIHGFLN